jgi:hypothetical protein
MIGSKTSYERKQLYCFYNKDGQSITTLDIASPASTKSMFTLVRSANDPENNDLSAAGANVIVTISKWHQRCTINSE